ncbi:hypothetical protein [Streptacidiphilus sp. EB103A]
MPITDFTSGSGRHLGGREARAGIGDTGERRVVLVVHEPLAEGIP